MDLIQVELFHIFEKFRFEKNIEIEVRIGWIGSAKFKSHIPFFHFNQIIEQLESCKLFTDIIHSKTIDTTFNYKYRSIYDTFTFKTIVMEKCLLYKVDIPLPGTPFDIRIVVNKEVVKDPCKLILKDVTFLQTKIRKSFIYKMWSYDITERIVDPYFLELYDDTNHIFSVEIEFIPSFCCPDISSEYLSISLTEKINDLLNIPSIKLT
jgi:hypothetical protein